MATKLRIENGKWEINASFNRFRRAGHAGAASLALADNSPCRTLQDTDSAGLHDAAISAMHTHRGECGFFVHIEQNDIIM
jgi:hypothetical protein